MTTSEGSAHDVEFGTKANNSDTLVQKDSKSSSCLSIPSAFLRIRSKKSACNKMNGSQPVDPPNAKGCAESFTRQLCRTRKMELTKNDTKQTENSIIYHDDNNNNGYTAQIPKTQNGKTTGSNVDSTILLSRSYSEDGHDHSKQKLKSDCGLYATYKAASIRFVNGLRTFCPKSIFENDSTVYCLVLAVEHINEHAIMETSRSKAKLPTDPIVSDYESDDDTNINYERHESRISINGYDSAPKHVMMPAEQSMAVNHKNGLIECMDKPVLSSSITNKASSSNPNINNDQSHPIFVYRKVSKRLLSDLALMIRVRLRVAKSFGCSTKDSSSLHSYYFLSVLLFCWSKLKPLVGYKIKTAMRPNATDNYIQHTDTALECMSMDGALLISNKNVPGESSFDIQGIANKTCSPFPSQMGQYDSHWNSRHEDIRNFDEGQDLYININGDNTPDGRSVTRGKTSFSENRLPSFNHDGLDNRITCEYDDTESNDEGDVDDDYDKLEDVVTKPIDKPVSPQIFLNTCNRSFSSVELQHLIDGDDRFHAIVYLQTLNELMGYNVEQYRSLKESCRENSLKQNQDPSIQKVCIEQLLEATACANFAMQRVLSLEKSLSCLNPFLTTFYRVIAAAFFPDLIESLTIDIRAYQLQKRQQHLLKQKNLETVNDEEEFPPTAAAEFISDCIECSFRSANDPYNRVDEVTRSFSVTWQVNNIDLIARYSDMIRVAVQLETPIGQEHQTNQHFFQSAKQPLPNQWLQYYDYIGGEKRSMVHTHRLIQSLSYSIEQSAELMTSDSQTTTRLELKRGYFGGQFDETHCRAATIHDDLDEYVMGDVLPYLIDICMNGLVSTKLPREDELLPLFVLLKRLIQYPTLPIPSSLTFGVHTLLTAIYEIQGDNDLRDISLATKSCFDLFISQLLEHRESIHPQGRRWKENLEKMIALRSLPQCMDPQPSDYIQQRSMWNPLVGGMFLTYLTFYANLEGGAAMIDSMAQLRIVLHLYHALKQNCLLARGRIPVLDTIYSYFEDSKAVWYSRSKPQSGELMVSWWLAYGMKSHVARELGKKSRDMPVLQLISSPSISQFRSRDKMRRLTPITSEHLSKSFRRISLGDFSDVVDLYHTPRQKREGKGTTFYHHAVCCNDTMDAICFEHEFLSINLISISALLNEFTYELFKEMEWKTEVDSLVEATPENEKTLRRSDGKKKPSFVATDRNFERYVMMLIIAQRILGPLDSGELNNSHSELGQQIIRFANFFICFFDQNLVSNKIQFLSPNDNDKE